MVNFMSKIVLHCDMNNFFASVEMLLDPSLKNKCIAVCGSKEERRGIVLAKNEAAKKYGVLTAESIWKAQKKCPDLTIVSPHYEYYSYYSQKAKDIYLRFTDLVEPFGIDECWLDVTGSTRLFGSGVEIANKIRSSIRNELGLTVSVGVSFNKIFAKLGSDMKKPDATTVINEQYYKQKIFCLPVDSLLGVGKSINSRFCSMGINTIGDLANMPPSTMEYRFGKQGIMLWNYANGLDDSPVKHFKHKEIAKSIGHGTTTAVDLKNNDEVKKLILSLSLSVSHKLRKNELSAGAIQVAVRDASLVTRDFQIQLPQNTNNAVEIAKNAFEIFKMRYDWHSNVHSVTVRAINLMPSDTPIQLDMFHNNDHYEKIKKIDKTIDKVSNRYGKNTIIPMSLVNYLENIN